MMKIMSFEKPKMISVMTPFPHSIDVSATLAEAKRVMAVGEFRHLPVTQEGHLVGILSDRDIKLALAVAHTPHADDDLTVRDACNFEIYVVTVDDLVQEVAQQMAERRMGSALVTKGTKLVGIFTTTDACKHYAELLKRSFPDA